MHGASDWHMPTGVQCACKFWGRLKTWIKKFMRCSVRSGGVLRVCAYGCCGLACTHASVLFSLLLDAGGRQLGLAYDLLRYASYCDTPLKSLLAQRRRACPHPFRSCGLLWRALLLRG